MKLLRYSCVLETKRKMLIPRIESKKPIAIEVLPLRNYYLAEEYHQKYLDKNIHGYCHIGQDKFKEAILAKDPIQSKHNLR